MNEAYKLEKQQQTKKNMKNYRIRAEIKARGKKKNRRGRKSE